MAIYMKFPDTRGSVTAEGYQDMIELTSLQWGGNCALRIGPGQSGSTATPVSMSEVSATKRLDRSSPLLFSHFAERKLLPVVTFDFTKTTSGRVHTFLNFELHDVFISHYDLSSGGDAPNEKIVA